MPMSLHMQYWTFLLRVVKRPFQSYSKKHLCPFLCRFLCQNTDMIPNDDQYQKKNRLHASQISFSTGGFVTSALSPFCQIGVVQVLNHIQLLLIFHRKTQMLFFFSFTMLLGAMLSNVCAKVFLIPLSLSLRHDVSLICVKCGRKKNLKKKSTWREEKKSFRKYATEAFN